MFHQKSANAFANIFFLLTQNVTAEKNKKNLQVTPPDRAEI